MDPAAVLTPVNPGGGLETGYARSARRRKRQLVSEIFT
jgi:hypothetical protein